jgi:hypothetical protein
MNDEEPAHRSSFSIHRSKSGERHVNGDMVVRRFAVSIQACDCISGQFHVE